MDLWSASTVAGGQTCPETVVVYKLCVSRYTDALEQYNFGAVKHDLRREPERMCREQSPSSGFFSHSLSDAFLSCTCANHSHQSQRSLFLVMVEVPPAPGEERGKDTQTDLSRWQVSAKES